MGKSLFVCACKMLPTIFWQKRRIMCDNLRVCLAIRNNFCIFAAEFATLVVIYCRTKKELSCIYTKETIGQTSVRKLHTCFGWMLRSPFLHGADIVSAPCRYHIRTEQETSLHGARNFLARRGGGVPTVGTAYSQGGNGVLARRKNHV